MTLAPLLDAHAVAAAALDGLRDGVLVVSGGDVLVANRAAHSLMGRGPGELAGLAAPPWVAGAEARGGAIDQWVQEHGTAVDGYDGLYELTAA